MMMQRIGRAAFATFGCLLAAGTIATQAGETKYKVNLEYLNTTPGQGGLDYAFDQSAGGGYIGTVKTVDPDSNDGFRIGVEAIRGQTTWMLGYASFDLDQTQSTLNPDGLSGTLTLDDFCSACQAFPFARAGYQQDYTRYNLGVGYQLRPDSKLGLQVLGGLVMGEIEERYDVLYSDDAAITGSTDVITQRTETEAIGINLGLVPSYDVNSWMRVFGRINFNPMMADSDRHFMYQEGGTGTTGLFTDVDLLLEENDLIQRTDVALGVEFKAADWLDIALGYEAEMWLNYPGFLKVTSESGEETIDRGGDDLSYSGFFLRAGFRF